MCVCVCVCVCVCETTNNFDRDPGRHFFITEVSFKPFSSSTAVYNLCPEERKFFACIKKTNSHKIDLNRKSNQQGKHKYRRNKTKGNLVQTMISIHTQAE